MINTAKSVILTVLTTFLVSAFAEATTEIVVNDASPEIFPQSWQVAPYSAEAEPLPGSAEQKCHEMIVEEMAKYPQEILDENLKQVYAVSRLRYKGVAAGGTNSRSRIYLAFNERSTEPHFRRSFHAEFSSILLRNFPDKLDTAAWESVNPDDFVYGRGGVQAILDDRDSINPDAALNEKGFLHEYSTASLQEDFNSIAARLFVGDPNMWEAINRSPKLQKKAELTMAFYEQLNPKFTKEFFESLRENPGVL